MITKPNSRQRRFSTQIQQDEMLKKRFNEQDEAGINLSFSCSRKSSDKYYWFLEGWGTKVPSWNKASETKSNCSAQTWEAALTCGRHTFLMKGLDLSSADRGRVEAGNYFSPAPLEPQNQQTSSASPANLPKPGSPQQSPKPLVSDGW